MVRDGSAAVNAGRFLVVAVSRLSLCQGFGSPAVGSSIGFQRGLPVFFIMARINFTANLQRHLEVAEMSVSAGTVRTVLEQVFQQNPRLKSYLLDDQDSLRQHVAIFINGNQVIDRVNLTDAVSADSEVYVVQALSGG